jgi:hypothetical protein
MPTSVPGALVKKANIVKKNNWKLCSQLLKNEKGVVFYVKFSPFGILN